MELIGVVTDIVRSSASGVHALIQNPREMGRKIGRITKVVGQVSLGIRDEYRYSALLRSMYPEDGERSTIAVPRLDCLSDLEVQSIFNEASTPQAGAMTVNAYFREWLILGGELDESAKSYFGKEAQLSEAITEIDTITGSVDPSRMLIRACVDDDEDEIAESIRRGSASHSGDQERYSVSYMSRLGSRHPGLFSHQGAYNNILDIDSTTRLALSRDLSIEDINVEGRISNATFDVTDALQSRSKILGLQIGKCELLAYYEDNEGVSQAMLANSEGVQSTCPVDGMCAPENMLISLLVMLVSDSIEELGRIDFESITIALLQACSKREDMAQVDRARGINVATDATLRKGQRHLFSTHTNVRRWLTMTSKAMYKAADRFSRVESKDEIRTGLTLEEARKCDRECSETPDYSYSRRDDALELFKSLCAGDKDVDSGTGENPRESSETVSVFPTGVMHDADRQLLSAMRRQVASVQKNYKKGSAKRDIKHMSGSMWLDRIAKGKLLTGERAKELTYARLRQDVPQEFESPRETGFYLPLYKVTVVVPRVEDFLNIRYARLQVGSESELTSAVTVLVSSVLWANAQDEEVVEEIIRADKAGTGDLLKFSSGRLSVQLKKSFLKKARDEALSVSNLIDVVTRDCAGHIDRDWVVREVLALACVLGVTYTPASARTACYLKTIEGTRSCDKDVKDVIVANAPVPMDGVEVRQITDAEMRLTFLLMDGTLPSSVEVILEPTHDCREEDISKRIMGKNDGRRLITHMVSQPSRHRELRGSVYGILRDVGAQLQQDNPIIGDDVNIM